MVYLALVFCRLPFRTKKFDYLAHPSTYYLSDKLAVTVKTLKSQTLKSFEISHDSSFHLPLKDWLPSFCLT